MSRISQPFAPSKRLIRSYPVLRHQLKSISMGYEELARGISRSRIYVARCMTGRVSFTLAECYAIRTLTGLTDRSFEEVFPC